VVHGADQGRCGRATRNRPATRCNELPPHVATISPTWVPYPALRATLGPFRDRRNRAANRLDSASASGCAGVRRCARDATPSLFQTCDQVRSVHCESGKHGSPMTGAITPRGRLQRVHINASEIAASADAARASLTGKTRAKFDAVFPSRGKRLAVLNGSRQAEVCGRLSAYVWLRSSPRTRTAPVELTECADGGREVSGVSTPWANAQTRV
jgi:hypothetical protein